MSNWWAWFTSRSKTIWGRHSNKIWMEIKKRTVNVCIWSQIGHVTCYELYKGMLYRNQEKQCTRFNRQSVNYYMYKCGDWAKIVTFNWRCPRLSNCKYEQWNETKVDIWERGFWDRSQQAFLDVRIFWPKH